MYGMTCGWYTERILLYSATKTIQIIVVIPFDFHTKFAENAQRDIVPRIKYNRPTGQLTALTCFTIAYRWAAWTFVEEQLSPNGFNVRCRLPPQQLYIQQSYKYATALSISSASPSNTISSHLWPDVVSNNGTWTSNFSNIVSGSFYLKTIFLCKTQ